MKALNFLLLVLLFASCDMHLKVAGDETYIISEGQHSSRHSFRGFDGNTLKFEATFDESAIYNTRLPENQMDVNKLMGFSSCKTYHHQNSGRIGWRWFNDRIEIFGYVYFEGERVEEFITDVPLHTVVQYEISKLPEGYYFKVGEKELILQNSNSCTEGGANYVLWPYFGGDEPAPQDIKIIIQSIEETNSETGNLKNG